MYPIKISNRTFYICEPTFAVLDAVKNETGLDLAVGVKSESMKEIQTDFKKLALTIGLITKDEPEDSFDLESVEERKEFFFHNGKMSDFIQAMDFFSQVLRGSGGSTPSPAAKEKTQKKNPKSKQKMKLVK